MPAGYTPLDGGDFAFWRGYPARVDLSAITCIIGGDLHYLPAYVQNVRREFNCPRTEILFAVYDDDAFAAVLQQTGQLSCPVKIIKLTHDPGLYKSWDLLIKKHATAPLVTTAAVDDGRNRQSARAAVRLFKRDPELAVVSFTSLVRDEDGNRIDTWWSPKLVPHLTQLSLSMLVKTNRSGLLAGSENIPHCAPIWRRSLHNKYGYFYAPFKECNDYAFFLRVSLGGEKMVHFSTKAGGVLYTLRRKSHNRRFRVEAEVSCEDNIFEAYGLRWLGLYNNLYFHNNANIARRSLNIAIVNEVLPLNQEGGNNRLMQLVEFFALNGHRVTLMARSSWRIDQSAHSNMFRRLHVQTMVDQDVAHVSNTISRLRYGKYDYVFVFLWFWRFWGPDGFQSQAELLLEGGVSPQNMAIISDDVHHLRCAQIGISRHICDAVKEKEQNLLRRVPLVVTITREDEASYKVLGAAKTLVLPYAVTPEKSRYGLGVRDLCLPNRLRVTYVGSGHEANVDAVRWFMSEVVPLINKSVHLTARFTYVGSEKWERLAQEYGLETDSFDRTEDVEAIMKETRVLIAPVTVSGTGVSTKVFDSMVFGIPCVTTLAGTTGIDDPVTFLHVAPERDAKQFAFHVSKLFLDDMLWHNTSQAAKQNARKYTRRAWVNNSHFMELFT